MSTPNIDDVAQTLAEYERLAIATGAAVRIDPPEFSDGATPLIGSGWSPFWTAEVPPVVARVTVHRDGIPTTVYVAWDESFPADESWRALWLAKPMRLFGAYVVRAALRRAFRDAIGDRREPDETHPGPADASTSRDWEAEIRDANTTDAVHALHAQMKAVRAVTVPRERALRDRLAELARRALYEPTPADAWQPQDQPAETPSPRPAARDYLPPQNRADRRAATRKKGRRR
ncbi:hypothetical protein [Microbacterium galbinum]|uniref:hypothetical protein n=1 Tax=Microbacterium galbinum TaxID=2851646 RepID=UPI001FFCEEFB|nr:hypothetical protein [Microbacterium galbinum]MCK2031236.1 hypothetical protein [Microbacterium galbinum]